MCCTKVSFFYHPQQIAELKKALGITLDNIEGLLSEREFIQASKLTKIANYRERGLITPVGKGMSASKISFFYARRQIAELKKALGSTLDSTEGLLSERQFIQASGLTKIADYRERGLITPVGKAIKQSGLASFYHPRQIAELKKRLADLRSR